MLRKNTIPYTFQFIFENNREGFSDQYALREKAQEHLSVMYNLIFIKADI